MSNKRQIEAAAERIRRLLNDDAEPLYLTTDLRTMGLSDGRQHRFYLVDYENAAGACLIHTTRDAETGRLISVDHALNRVTTRKAKPSGVTNPARVAWRWLERLDLSRLSPHWTLFAPPEPFRYHWKVVLHSDKYCATVVFDRETEDLANITMQPVDPINHLP